VTSMITMKFIFLPLLLAAQLPLRSAQLSNPLAANHHISMAGNKFLQRSSAPARTNWPYASVSDAYGLEEQGHAVLSSTGACSRTVTATWHTSCDQRHHSSTKMSVRSAELCLLLQADVR
jgi:hypothetical protein